MAVDPIHRISRWLEDARKAGIELPEAAALATADERGRPSVRYVLLQEIDERGITFYTNSFSRKGTEIKRNPWIAIAVYWHETDRQVRIEGELREVPRGEADSYWESRPRENRLAALASRQDSPLENRKALTDRYREMTNRYKGKEIPRPPYWTGYRVVPSSIEFWTRQEPRMHRRELFTRTKEGWKSQLIQP